MFPGTEVSSLLSQVAQLFIIITSWKFMLTTSAGGHIVRKGERSVVDNHLCVGRMILMFPNSIVLLLAIKYWMSFGQPNPQK